MYGGKALQRERPLRQRVKTFRMLLHLYKFTVIRKRHRPALIYFIFNIHRILRHILESISGESRQEDYCTIT